MIQKPEHSVPGLRFPEYYGNWTYTKLGDIGSFTGGGTPDTNVKKYWKGDIPWISSSDLIDGDIHNLKPTRFITEKAINESSTKLVPANSVMFVSRVGVGKLAINQTSICTSQDFTTFTPDNGNSFFIGYLFQSEKNLLLRYSQGTSIQGLTSKDLKAIKTLQPEDKEQKKIATFLAAVDKKIEQISKKKNLVEQYKKGMLQKLFSQQIRFKDDQGNEYPSWEEKRLGDIAEFTKGKGISKNDIDEAGANECIRYGQLYTDYNETIFDIKSRTNVPSEKLVFSEINDIIIPASGETQIDIATASCVLKNDIALGGDLNIIKTKHNGVFLTYYLNSVRKFDVARLSQGISVVHLYPAQLKLLNLSLPSKPEQQTIANFLSAIDCKIELITTQLEKAQSFKKGLLQQMFV